MLLIEQTRIAARASFIDKSPAMDWSTEDNLCNRFNMRTPIHWPDSEKRGRNTGEQGMEQFNSLDLSANDQ